MTERVENKLDVMTEIIFKQLLTLTPKEAAAVIALLTIRFYEEAEELGTPEEYVKNLGEIITDELNLKL
jgi:hypothetical protein